jgi:Tol biopolymer transport system component
MNRLLFLLAFAFLGLAGCSTINSSQEKIVFWAIESSEEMDIWMADPDGSHLQQVTTAAGLDALGRISPDGTEMVFLSDRDGILKVYIMNLLKGENSSQAIYTPDVTYYEYAQLAWSPNGEQIAVKLMIHSNTKLLIIDRMGKIIASRDFEGRTSGQFDWMADSDMLIYSNETYPNWSPTNELYLLKTELKGDPIHITNNSFSDGEVRVSKCNKLLFVQSTDGKNCIINHDVDSNESLEITCNNHQLMSPQWSINCEQIIFGIYNSLNWEIYLASSDNTEPPHPLITSIGMLENKSLIPSDWAVVKTRR